MDWCCECGHRNSSCPHTCEECDTIRPENCPECGSGRLEAHTSYRDRDRYCLDCQAAFSSSYDDSLYTDYLQDLENTPEYIQKHIQEREDIIRQCQEADRDPDDAQYDIQKLEREILELKKRMGEQMARGPYAFKNVQTGEICQNGICACWDDLWEGAGFGGITEDQVIKGFVAAVVRWDGEKFVEDIQEGTTIMDEIDYDYDFDSVAERCAWTPDTQVNMLLYFIDQAQLGGDLEAFLKKQEEDELTPTPEDYVCRQLIGDEEPQP